jgi:hypothetical protein
MARIICPDLTVSPLQTLEDCGKRGNFVISGKLVAFVSIVGISIMPHMLLLVPKDLKLKSMLW